MGQAGDRLVSDHHTKGTQSGDRHRHDVPLENLIVSQEASGVRAWHGAGQAPGISACPGNVRAHTVTHMHTCAHTLTPHALASLNMNVIRTLVSTDMWIDLELLALEVPARPVVNIRQTRRHPVHSHWLCQALTGCRALYDGWLLSAAHEYFMSVCTPHMGGAVFVCSRNRF